MNEEMNQRYNRYPDIICFSHLRWNFVYQRPQQLLSRFAEFTRIFFFEEPVFNSTHTHYETISIANNIQVIVPHLAAMNDADKVEAQRSILDSFISDLDIQHYSFWYYTPMALSFSDHLNPQCIIYDCMDELAAFQFAPSSLKEHEINLLNKADLVFTGGKSLYESKEKIGGSKVHLFPSSIDAGHFKKARIIHEDVPEQKNLLHPRIGFCGVIDERMNTLLVQEMAAEKTSWQFIFIGPVVKIEESMLPKSSNIHYFGMKPYEILPQYFAGWDVAMMPFALNESTRYISPTKTPEYLAAGLPVISTSINDVVFTYKNKEIVWFADTVKEFISAIEKELQRKKDDAWLKRVDDYLLCDSWDETVLRMKKLIDESLYAKLPFLKTNYRIQQPEHV